MRTQGIREEESGYSAAGVVSLTMMISNKSSITMSCSRSSSLSSSSTSYTFVEHYHVLSEIMIIIIDTVIKIINTINISKVKKRSGDLESYVLSQLN